MHKSIRSIVKQYRTRQKYVIDLQLPKNSRGNNPLYIGSSCASYCPKEAIKNEILLDLQTARDGSTH